MHDQFKFHDTPQYQLTKISSYDFHFHFQYLMLIYQYSKCIIQYTLHSILFVLCRSLSLTLLIVSHLIAVNFIICITYKENLIYLIPRSETICDGTRQISLSDLYFSFIYLFILYCLLLLCFLFSLSNNSTLYHVKDSAHSTLERESRLNWPFFWFGHSKVEGLLSSKLVPDKKN